MTLIFLLLSSKMKQRFIVFANYYMIFKSVFNSVVMMSIISLLSTKYDINVLIQLLLFTMIYYPYTGIEIYLIECKVNFYRGVVNTPKEFFRNWMIGIATNTVALWIVFLLNRKINGGYFILVLYFFAIAFPWFYIYVMELGEKKQETEQYRNLIREKFRIACDIKMYLFDGKLKKDANMYAKGVLGKKYIKISNYITENLSEEEICAIILHEISHCNHYDLETMALAINFICLLFFIMGNWFQLVSMPIFPGIFLLIGGVVVLLLCLMLLKRGQEHRADRYVVETTGEYKIFADALTKVYRLSNTPENPGKFLAMFSSHPSLALRIRNIEKAYRKQKVSR